LFFVFSEKQANRHLDEMECNPLNYFHNNFIAVVHKNLCYSGQSVGENTATTEQLDSWQSSWLDWTFELSMVCGFVLESKWNIKMQ